MPFALKEFATAKSAIARTIIVIAAPVVMLLFPLVDNSKIKNNIKYAITNYRAIVLNKTGSAYLMLKQGLPIQTRSGEHESNSICLGNAVRLTPAQEKKLLTLETPSKGQLVDELILYRLEDVATIENLLKSHLQ